MSAVSVQAKWLGEQQSSFITSSARYTVCSMPQAERAGEMLLTAAELERYRRDGYVVMRQCFDAPPVAARHSLAAAGARPPSGARPLRWCVRSSVSSEPASTPRTGHCLRYPPKHSHHSSETTGVCSSLRRLLWIVSPSWVITARRCLQPHAFSQKKTDNSQAATGLQLTRNDRLLVCSSRSTHSSCPCSCIITGVSASHSAPCRVILCIHKQILSKRSTYHDQMQTACVLCLPACLQDSSRGAQAACPRTRYPQALARRQRHRWPRRDARLRCGLPSAWH